MKARFKFEDPNKIEATMTLTMNVKEWCELRDQLETQWPSSDLSLKIGDLLGQARKILWAEDEDK